MRTTTRALVAALAAVVSTGIGPSVRAQDAPPEPVVVSLIGASVTAGFVDPKPRPDGEPNSTVRLSVALQGLYGDAEVRLRDRSDLATFLDPEGRQERHVARAVEDGAVITVAVDFPFWFGYGRVAIVDGDERGARLARLERGLALLERIEGPLLVGDFPDMTGADPRMLRASQIPSPEVLAALNARLREWAAGREGVRVFELSSFVAAAKNGGIEVEHDGTRVLLAPDVLLQGDRLHATRLGVAVLTAEIAAGLRALLPDGHPARPPLRTLGDLAEATRSRLLLDELTEAARPAAVEAGGGKR